MPSFATPVLPSTPGLALGSPDLPWTVYQSQTVNVYGSAVNVIPWSATPAMDATAAGAVEMTLTGDVTSSSFVSGAGSGYVQLVVFYIAQDATGHHKFSWPANFQGCRNVDGSLLDMNPNQVMVQAVYWSGTRQTAIAAAPAVFYP